MYMQKQIHLFADDTILNRKNIIIFEERSPSMYFE